MFLISLTENQDDKYYEELQTKITDLSLLLFDKLEFLEVSKKGLTNFQVMFIEMEVRLMFVLKFSLSIYNFLCIQLRFGHHETASVSATYLKMFIDLAALRNLFHRNIVVGFCTTNLVRAR